MRKRKAAWISAGIALLFLAALVYTTFGNRRYRCEVCMSYAGRSACRTAAAGDRDAALRTATENACGEIAGGVTGAIGCENTRPDRVTWMGGH